MHQISPRRRGSWQKVTRLHCPYICLCCASLHPATPATKAVHCSSTIGLHQSLLFITSHRIPPELLDVVFCTCWSLSLYFPSIIRHQISLQTISQARWNELLVFPTTTRSTTMSEAAVYPPSSPISPQSGAWTPPSPDPPRSPAWTEYTLRSPESSTFSPSSVFSPTAGEDGTPPHNPWTRSTPFFLAPWTPEDRLKAKARAKRRRKAKARAEREAKAPVKTRDKPVYDQKTFESINLKALQTKNYEAKDLRRLDIEVEVPPTTYLDSCCRTRTHKVGRREKKYTRWLPDDGEGFMFGEEESDRKGEEVASGAWLGRPRGRGGEWQGQESYYHQRYRHPRCHHYSNEAQAW